MIGLFGLTTAIFLHRWLSRGIAPCLFISSIALAVLVLPYVVRTTQLALEAVPRSLRAAGMSLGASRLMTLIVVSHYLDQVRRLSDRIFRLDPAR